MESIDYIYILPLILLACAPVILLLAISIFRNHRLIYLLAVVSTIVFIASTIYTWTRLTASYKVGDLLVIDSFSLFYFVLLGVAALVIILISYPYLSEQQVIKEEYYVLFLTSVFGAVVLVASTNFVSFFLGLEILSISLYSIIAYVKTRIRSVEGGLKYLILAAASSALLLFGMALIYIDNGSLSFSELSKAFANGALLSEAGLALMLVGIGFKLAVVPFHMWTPDIYEAAPAPISALIATISKGSVIAVLLRFIYATGSLNIAWFVLTLSIMSIASMLVGSILALRQNNIKRLLAYSSIAHLGYILIAVLAKTSISLEAVNFYLVAYFISILGAFGTLSIFSSSAGEIENIEDFQGLFWTRPGLSIIFSVMLFSLVGIPLTAGFMGKFYIMSASISNGMWSLAVVLVISSVIGLYYYLRVIKTMLSSNEDESTGTWINNPSRLGFAVLSVLCLFTILLGVFPSQLINLIQSLSLSF